MLKTIKFRVELFKNTLNPNAILVYQMGKVGSSSLCESIEKYNIPTSHVHFFGPMKIMNHKDKTLKSMVMWPILKVYSLILRKILKREKKKIITIVREPISRNISMMFQVLNYLLCDYLKDDKNHFTSMNRMLREFLYNYMHNDMGYEWFNKEFKKNTGINIYKYPFNKEQGYQLISKDNIEVMIIRLDKMNELEKEIGEFIGVKDFALSKANVSSNKWYNQIYKDFINNPQLDKKFVEDSVENSHIKHFYTKKEVETLKSKWSNSF